MKTLVEYEEASKLIQRSRLLNKETLVLVKEYSYIASQERLSEQDADRLSEIIELAQEDSCLDFWMNEVDHFLDHELGLVTGKFIYPFETANQTQVLAEHLNFWMQRGEEMNQSDGAVELLEEIQEFLRSGTRDVQKKLHTQGFDPGPIDGVVGPRTQDAIMRFQQAHRLIVSGQLDSNTQLALGYR